MSSLYKPNRMLRAWSDIKLGENRCFQVGFCGWRVNHLPFLCALCACGPRPGGSSGVHQAPNPPGVQVQPDGQSQPWPTPAAGSLCHPGSKCCLWTKAMMGPFPSSPRVRSRPAPECRSCSCSARRPRWRWTRTNPWRGRGWQCCR